MSAIELETAEFFLTKVICVKEEVREEAELGWWWLG